MLQSIYFRCNENNILSDDRRSDICNIRWSANGHPVDHCSTGSIHEGWV